MHKLLKRQLRKHWPQVDNTEFQDFLDAVDSAYKSSDDDRSIVEHSLELTSQELFDRNTLLREKVQELESTQVELEQIVATIQATFDSTREGIFSYDAPRKQVHCNRVGRNILGLDPDESYFPASFCIRKLLAKLKDPDPISDYIRNLRSSPHEAEHVFLTTEFLDGQIFELYSVPKILHGQLIGRVWCFRDITQYRESLQLIEHQASHDALTNLPNRFLLEDRIKHAIAIAKRESSLLALIFIDLDYFKKVNDSSGHQVGDQILKRVAARIQHSLREGDTLSRIGGDEFVVLVENIHSLEVVSELCHRIHEALLVPFECQNSAHTVGCSIGISLYPNDANEAESLLRKADMAMYYAKQRGRSNFQFFNYSLEENALYRADLEEGLRHAIANQEFYLEYQPKINLSTRQIYGAEALIRWQYKGKMVPPDEFIGIAEQAGMIDDLSRWVFTEVCRTLSQWYQVGARPPRIAVNFSSINVSSPGFTEFLSGTMMQYKVEGHALEFELTESVMFANTEAGSTFMAFAREKGISLSLDDFGTGYASLSYLHKLPVDVIKVDKSFILNLFRDKQNQVITNIIIMLAKNLGLDVVAEGVETEEIHNWLNAHGCRFGQGYLYHRPMAKEDFERLAC